MIPKVKFVAAGVNDVFWTIHYFLSPDKNGWDWSGAIYKNYPKLKGILKSIKNEKERVNKEYNFFREVFGEDKNKLEKKKDIFQREWDKINDKIMTVLSEVIEQKWKKKDQNIFARVTINPICPRYIKERTFDVFYIQTPEYMKSVAIHEILHFIYFEKWKRVFPKTKEKEFDSPHLVWHLSEMVPQIILHDERIQKIFRYDFKSYLEYQRFKIDGKPLLLYLQKFYDNRKNFEGFLRESWKFVKDHEEEIKKLK